MPNVLTRDKAIGLYLPLTPFNSPLSISLYLHINS